MSPASAIARRTFSDARVRTGSFALLFAAAAAANVVGYRRAYPTFEDRLQFLRSFGADKSVRLFYGVPHDLLTVGGYAAWRVGGMLSIFAGMWGLLAAVRAFRTEEDAGRQELVLAGAVTRAQAFAAALLAIGAGALILWLALLVGQVATRLPALGSAYLAVAVVSMVPVFAGVGALASQIASSRRLALELGTAVLGTALVLRVIADTTSLGALRWATPLGWVEESRPFADPRPEILLLPLVTGAALLLAAGRIAGRRDVGTGLVHARDSAPTNGRLLGSPTALTLRTERGSLVAWLVGVGGFSLILGVVASGVSATALPARLREQLESAGLGDIVTPAGYLGLTFVFFAFALSLFACSQVAAARREESEQQLETLLALPTGRSRWLGGRLLLAAGATAALAICAGMLAWAGAASQHADVSWAQMLGTGANCLPASFLFLGVGALAFGVAPRASTAVAYGFTSAAFVWALLGGALGVPAWLLDLSPFHQIGLVPVQPFRAVAAAAMLAIGVAAGLIGLWTFRRRDLTGA